MFLLLLLPSYKKKLLTRQKSLERIQDNFESDNYKNDDGKYEASLYVPSFEGKEKEYEIYDTVEKAFLTNLKENCINTK